MVVVYVFVACGTGEFGWGSGLKGGVLWLKLVVGSYIGCCGRGGR